MAMGDECSLSFARDRRPCASIAGSRALPSSAAALAEAEMRGLSLSAATSVNLQALGVKLRDAEPDLREAAGGVA